MIPTIPPRRSLSKTIGLPPKPTAPAPTSEKRIAYLLTESGIDGRAPTTIVSAFWSEAERDAAFAADPNRNWLGKSERIVNLSVARKEALAKLNGLDRLLLGL